MDCNARAPGTILLSGEHAVLHGSTAIASSISLYTYVSLTFPIPSGNGDTLKLQYMGFEFSWSVGRIKEALAGNGGGISSTPTSCPSECLKAIGALVELMCIPESKIELAAGLSAFLWLYTSIHGFKPATVVVSSQLPSGMGLGSSAAFCVALSAALLASYNCVHVDMKNLGWISFGERELVLVNDWAFEGERIINGKAAGFGSTVSSHGNMIMFRSDGLMTRTKSNQPLTMLITNTKVERNKKALVLGVAERTIRYPDSMGFVFKAVDSICKELLNNMVLPVSGGQSIAEKEKKIAELMEMNQGLLQSMGVSHASIETVIRTTSKYKLASKLTGAGGGGCVITLLPTWVSVTIIVQVIEELKSFGFQSFIAEIGGKGVEISF